MIKAKDIDQALYKICKKLKNAPEHSPRNQKTKELIQETIEIKNPRSCIIDNPARKFSNKYLLKELEWYNSGDRSVKEIGKYASLWNKIADENGNVNSNYGHIAFFQELEKFDGNQFDWVVESLKDDKDSRQAIINFNQTHHKYENVKDFVCTINTQYLIRNNKLISITNMRSNDVIFGFGNDIPFFSNLQTQIFKNLKEHYSNLRLGPMYHTAGSLHVYERHFEMLDNIIKEYESKNIKSKKIEDIL